MAINIFGSSFSLLSKVLDLRSQRHTVIASNLANVETPGYKSIHLEFEDELKKALPETDTLNLAKTHKEHMPTQGSFDDITPVVLKENRHNPRPDGNTVDMDKEFVKMSKNQLMYSAVAQILGKKFEGLLTAIREGK